jgi:hypothetical protein
MNRLLFNFDWRQAHHTIEAYCTLLTCMVTGHSSFISQCIRSLVRSFLYSQGTCLVSAVQLL